MLSEFKAALCPLSTLVFEFNHLSLIRMYLRQRLSASAAAASAVDRIHSVSDAQEPSHFAAAIPDSVRLIVILVDILAALMS